MNSYVEYMTDIRDIIFDTFPRMCGNPLQHLVYNRDELNRFATLNSSSNDSNFASSCSYYTNIPIFSDLFLETDETDVEPVRKVILWFESHKIPYVILHSGNRGFHVHGLFEPLIINQKTVKKFANLVLNETNTSHLFDPHVTGDIKRLCRIPNTQRLNNCWCVPITREELFTIDDSSEFKKLCKSPRFIDITIGKKPNILEFVKEEEETPIHSIEVAPPKEIFFLKHILRPCVFKSILTPNPKHNFRIAATVEMYNHGLTTSQIFNTFMRLNWIDFDIDKTHYQLYKIEEKRKNGELQIPFGKQKLGCEKKISCLKCILEN